MPGQSRRCSTTAQTVHYPFFGAGSVCHSRESGSTTRLVENPNISFLLHNGCPLEFIPCLTRDGHDNFLFKLSHHSFFCELVSAVKLGQFGCKCNFEYWHPVDHRTMPESLSSPTPPALEIPNAWQLSLVSVSAAKRCESPCERIIWIVEFPTNPSILSAY